MTLGNNLTNDFQMFQVNANTIVNLKVTAGNASVIYFIHISKNLFTKIKLTKKCRYDAERNP